MNQIMRLRRSRAATTTSRTATTAYRHEKAFVKNINATACSTRRPAARLLRRQVPPARGAELLRSLPAITKALQRAR
jgi:hypothetical protein